MKSNAEHVTMGNQQLDSTEYFETAIEVAAVSKRDLQEDDNFAAKQDMALELFFIHHDLSSVSIARILHLTDQEAEAIFGCESSEFKE
jgi:hypothetical protein